MEKTVTPSSDSSDKPLAEKALLLGVIIIISLLSCYKNAITPKPALNNFCVIFN